jgi:hypothetical protein
MDAAGTVRLGRPRFAPESTLGLLVVLMVRLIYLELEEGL